MPTSLPPLCFAWTMGWIFFSYYCQHNQLPNCKLSKIPKVSDWGCLSCCPSVCGVLLSQHWHCTKPSMGTNTELNSRIPGVTFNFLLLSDTWKPQTHLSWTFLWQPLMQRLTHTRLWEVQEVKTIVSSWDQMKPDLTESRGLWCSIPWAE